MIVRLAIDNVGHVQHEIEPCRCQARFTPPGETCARCGRYALATLLEAATLWYPPTTDELLRSFRGTDDV